MCFLVRVFSRSRWCVFAFALVCFRVRVGVFLHSRWCVFAFAQAHFRHPSGVPSQLVADRISNKNITFQTSSTRTHRSEIIVLRYCALRQRTSLS